MIDRLRSLDPRARALGALLVAVVLVGALVVVTAGDDGTDRIDVAADDEGSSTSRSSTSSTSSSTTATSALDATTSTAAGGSAPGGPGGSGGSGGSTATTRRPAPPTTKAPPPPTSPPPISGECNTSSGGSSGALASRYCSYRSTSGLPLMKRTAALDSIAQDWAQKLADDWDTRRAACQCAPQAQSDLVHRSRPDLQQRVRAACGNCNGWGENVAFAMDVDTIWTGWLESAVHLGNIRDGRNGEFGFGVATSGDGYLWATHNFGWHRS